MNTFRNLVRADRNFNILAVLTLAVVVTMVAVLGDRFLSGSNMQSMATQIAEFGLLALAMGLAMLTGGIDLSIVAAAVLSAIVCAKFLSGDILTITDSNSGLVMGVAILAALVTGVLCGLLNGLLIAKFSIPPILATLGTFILFTGVGMVITNGQSVAVALPAFANIGIATFASIPMIFLIMCVAFAGLAFFLKYTRNGRRIFLYGENSVALRFSGARNERLILVTYAVIGLLVGIAAIIMTSRVNSARVGFGDSYLLQAILVVVLAGFDPYGGRGRVGSLFLSLFMLQSLQSAFTIMRLDPYMKTFIWGAMLLTVMVANHILNQQSAKRPVAALPPQAVPKVRENVGVQK